MSYKSVREILNAVFDSSDDTLRTINKTDGEVLNMVLDESGDPALKVSMGNIDADMLNGIDGAEYMQKPDYELLAGTLSAPLFHAPLKNGLGLTHGAGSLTFSRATTAAYVDRYGVLQTASIDEPRFEKEGILIEGESTNIATYSADINSWSDNTRVVITPDAITAPDGTATMDKIAATSTFGRHYAQNIVSQSASVGTVYTGSIFVKEAEYNTATLSIGGSSVTNLYVDVDLVTGQATGRDLELFVDSEKMADGSWRFKLQITTNSSGNIGISVFPDTYNEYTGDDTSGIYAWGAQLEELPFASSYIPTTATAVTRSADTLTIPVADNMGPPIEGSTFIADVDVLGWLDDAVLGANARQTIFFINGCTYVSMFFEGNDEIVWFNGDTSGAFSIGGTEYSLTKDTSYRVAMTKDASEFRGYLDGVLQYSQPSIIDPSGLEQTDIINIGFVISNVRTLYGHISNFRIYDKALTEAQMRVA